MSFATIMYLVAYKKSTYKDKECPSASRPDWLEKLVIFHRVNVYICFSRLLARDTVLGR